MADDLYISGLNNGYSVSNATAANIQNEINKASSFENILNTAIEKKDEKELRNACVEFESYFIQTMFKEMRKTINSEGGLIPQSNAQNIFQGMLDEEYAKSSAQAGGIGLANMLYRQLSMQYLASKE